MKKTRIYAVLLALLVVSGTLSGCAYTDLASATIGLLCEADEQSIITINGLEYVRR